MHTVVNAISPSGVSAWRRPRLLKSIERNHACTVVAFLMALAACGDGTATVSGEGSGLRDAHTPTPEEDAGGSNDGAVDGMNSGAVSADGGGDTVDADQVEADAGELDSALPSEDATMDATSTVEAAAGDASDGAAGDGSDGDSGLNPALLAHPCGFHVASPGELLDVGHQTVPSVVQAADGRLLTADPKRWILWNSITNEPVATGPTAVPQPPHETQGLSGLNLTILGLVAMRGSVFVVEAPVGTLSFRSAVTGTELRSVTSSARRFGIAKDGSYVWGASATELTIWPTQEAGSVTVSGNYDFAAIFADAGELRVAKGPAGAKVIQYIDVSTGATRSSAEFSGDFRTWFVDGQHFMTGSGSTVWIYPRAAGAHDTILTGITGDIAGFGAYVWNQSGLAWQVYPFSEPSHLILNDSSVTKVDVSEGRLLFTKGYAEARDYAVKIVDLTEADPQVVGLTLPMPNVEVFGAASSGELAFVDRRAVVVTRANSGSMTPAVKLTCGQVRGLSGASSTGHVAIATAGGGVVIGRVGSSGDAILGWVDQDSDHIELSADGTVLGVGATIGDSPPADVVRILSLESGTILGEFLDADRLTFSMSPDGQRLSRLTNSGRRITSLDGSTSFFDRANVGAGRTHFAPNHTRFVTFEPGAVPPEGTSLFFSAEGLLINAAAARPVGWVDTTKLLGTTYQPSGIGGTQRTYDSTRVYDPDGTEVATLSVGQELQPRADGIVFSPVSSSRILYRDAILDLESGGAAVWHTAEPTTMSTFAAGRVVYLSGGRILVEEP